MTAPVSSADSRPGAPPVVIPMLAYEDGFAALAWLSRAFGFRERTRMAGPDGRLAHGEMEAGDGLVMLATPSPHYESPRTHRASCERARRWSEVPWVIDGVLVYVPDVDAHYARARAAGAIILSEPEDGFPGRRYRAEDPEGHRWMFMARPAGGPDPTPPRQGPMLGGARLTAFLATADAGRARRFYEGVLGLRLLSDDQFALAFDANGVQLRIQKVPTVEPPPFTALGWQVADLDAMVAALSAAGIGFERYSFMPQDAKGIWTAPGGTRVAWFKDPDGNLLSLAEHGDA